MPLERSPIGRVVGRHSLNLEPAASLALGVSTRERDLPEELLVLGQCLSVGPKTPECVLLVPRGDRDAPRQWQAGHGPSGARVRSLGQAPGRLSGCSVLPHLGEVLGWCQRAGVSVSTKPFLYSREDLCKLHRPRSWCRSGPEDVTLMPYWKCAVCGELFCQQAWNVVRDEVVCVLCRENSK